MRSIRVVIADSHPVVLHGLSNVLGAQRDFRIVACCRDGANCVEAIRSLAPDVVVLDVAMPDITGLELLAILNSENLRTRLVFFTASVEAGDLIMLAAAGAHSIIPRDVEPKVLVQALRQVAQGRRVLVSSEKIVSREQRANTRKALAKDALMTLTGRERQIMRLVSEGLSNKEIGRRLNITDGTIKVHLHHIFQKLDVSNRTALASLAKQSGGEALAEPLVRARARSGRKTRF